MPTAYAVVYDSFLSKITDYQLSSMSQSDAEANMLGWMNTAIAKFVRCKTDLTQRDDTAQQFNVTLKPLEVEVLANLMVVEYLQPKVKTSQTMRQMLSDSDYKTYSQANQIDSMLKLYSTTKSDADTLMTQYTYYTGDLGGLL